MRVLVTRAEAEGRATIARLRAAGHEGIAAPLLEIVIRPDVVLDLDGVQALILTSAQAVTALAAHADVARLKAVPVFTVGAKTAVAARHAGFTQVVSADGDRRDLVALIAARLDPAAGALLWAAGRDRRDELAHDLARAGFAVRIAEVYAAEAVRRLPERVVAEIAAGRVDAVLLHSPRSAAILIEALAACGFSPGSPPFRFHAISEAAAAPLGAAGRHDVVVAAEPTDEALVASLSSASG